MAKCLEPSAYILELLKLVYVLTDSSHLEVVPLPAFEQLTVLGDHFHLLITDTEAVLEDPLCHLKTSVVLSEGLAKFVLDRYD